MPVYCYICDNCSNEFEELQKYHDKPLKRCKKCGKNKLRRKITLPYYKQEPKTLGSLADMNSSKMTQERKDQIRPEKKIPDPPWGKPPPGLMNATEKQKADYIMTGKL